MQKKGLQPDNIDGYEKAHWIVLDFDNVIVHIFYEPIRMHYDLEGLWYGAEKIAGDTATEAISKKDHPVAA